MEHPSQIIENFEQILKKQCTKKSLVLYSDIKHSNKHICRQQDVISGVSRQLKAIQTADCIKGGKCVKLNMFNKSCFLSVDKLAICEEPNKHNVNKFETQCVSDTQLIDIIKDAESHVYTHKGMTQEFETSFNHTHLDKLNDKVNNVNVQEKSTTSNVKDNDNLEHKNNLITKNMEQFESCSNALLKLSKYDIVTNSSKENEINSVREEFKDLAIKNSNATDENLHLAEDHGICKIDTSVNILNRQKNEVNDMIIFNKFIETYDKDRTLAEVDEDTSQSTVLNIVKPGKPIAIDKFNVVIKDISRSPSPVFNVKAINTSNTVSPLVFNLDIFEKFEKIATPLIEENIDLKLVKHLINSQILGKELCLHTDTIDDRSLSPIIKFCDNNMRLDITKAEINHKNQINKKQIESVTDKHNHSLQDEILFSSDEENDYIHKESQNFPLTCAIETSICGQSNSPDTMMYVGFQTASNKSIQVLSESFVKAKSILSDSDDITTKNEPTLLEMVQKCDGISKNDTNEMGAYIESDRDNLEYKVMPEIKESIETDMSNITQVTVNNTDVTKTRADDIILVNVSEESNFEGYMKASYKKSKLSGLALAKCREVFQGIHLENTYEPENAVRTKQIENLINEKREPDNEECVSVTSKNYYEILPQNVVQANINDKIIHNNFNKNQNQNKIFAGFKTASNNDISISNNALEKTKQIFQDIDLRELNVCDKKLPTSLNKGVDAISYPKDLTKPINSSFIGFKTASNRDITISNEALLKSKNIFKGIDNVSTDNATSIHDFPTTINNEVMVSNETSVSKKKILNKLEFTENLNDSRNLNPYIFEPPPANNKSVRTFPEALDSKQMLQTLKTNNIVERDLNSNSSSMQDMVTPVFKGFQTASNNRVIVSDIALAKSKKLFEDLECMNTSKINHEKHILGNAEPPVFNGFQTASNKRVIVSDDALVKSKKLFEDLECINNSKIPKIERKKSGNAETLVFKGFQTASNKKVSISEAALANSKKMFQDIEFSDASLENKSDFSSYNCNIGTTEFKGFQTASLKKLTVSEEALAKSKHIFQDIDLLDKTNSTKGNVNKQPIICGGFQTASNKQVNISADALAKSRKIFQDSDDIKTFANDPIKNEDTKSHNDQLSSEMIENNIFGTKTIVNTPFRGFQTANNKTVQISEHALAKSREIFQNVDITTQNTNATDQNKRNFERENAKNNGSNETIQSHDFVSTFGFKTAGNKNIKISEAALKESNRIFDNLGTEFPITTNINTELKENYLDNGNMDSMIDTQVINNFEETLHTEDFRNVTPKSKRSGSPILSCPKAKRRKFETPYRSNQVKIINNEEIVDIKKITTILFDENYKKNKKYILKNLHNMVANDENNVDPYLMNFNFNNLLHFEFFDKRNDLKKDKIKIEDLKQLFKESVNAKLIPDGWLDNHLQLILWKLISYEIKFPKCLNLACTTRNVLNQLKYRYDRELYNAERPAIRKVLEKDDIASKAIVLCVVGVYVDGIEVNRPTSTTNIELLLTDGWYSIKATTDKMLAKLVCDGKIIVGTKILTIGAELVNCEQGVAPWEDTSSIRLKLSGNCTRRARWDARLGYHGNAAILTHLSNVKTDGGKVSKLRLYVTRVYPALYVEKFEDGSTVTRSERLEHLHETKYEAERQVLLEKLYEQVESEFTDWDEQNSEGFSDLCNKRRRLDSGSQISKIMKAYNDPVEFRNNLSNSQVQLLEEHTTKRREKMLQAIQTKLMEKMEQHGICQGRNVITLLKIRVVGIEERNGDVIVTKGMLSIWKPNDAVLELIREGSWIEVINVVPTAVRYSEIQISAGRQSIFSLSKYKESDKVKLSMQSLQRKCYSIKDLTKNPSATTDFNEIDTVGFVFLIDPSSQNFDSNKNQFQNVYIADSIKNVICINFWGGLKKFGFDNVLDTGQVVACVNLQKRAGNTKKNIPQYRVTEFSYFTKSPKNVNAKEMVDELNKKMADLDRRKFCEDCVKIKNNFSVQLQQKCENITPYRFNNIDLVQNKLFIDTPFGIRCKKKEDFNLSGLDFESTFKQTDSQELSPKSLLRKRKVNERITKLKMYGEPPPIAPIHLINKSENASKSYKSPLISISDVSNSVSSSKKVPELCTKIIEASDSPVTSVNRTYYVKNSVNPVRINFDHVDNNLSAEVDHFAEEFDGSPPLSLD